MLAGQLSESTYSGGVAPIQVAEWAGHSVAVLLQIYAKCLAGQEETARKRIEGALGLGDDSQNYPENGR
jgi:hypothetical protein